ncbi:group III truncated hemoglobin [Mucilaginibacter antarcticus]|uniref:group III truncated hemoglobin n=1 Tax=Mucilaginibacter antarcticus TaxID=1855725 RepID=UPI003628C03C
MQADEKSLDNNQGKMTDIKDETSIKILVDDFYTSVRGDLLLGPVFAEAIGGDWKPHLDKMYLFWNAALFGKPGFKGNPFMKHLPLPIKADHFERWVDLFGLTVDKHFNGVVAEDAKKELV